MNSQRLMIPYVVIVVGAVMIAIMGIVETARADVFAQMRLPDDLTNAADSARLSELSAITRLLDTTWWSVNLQTARLQKTFVERTERHQRQNPEIWDRAWRGLAWAQDSARCHGTLWAPDGEVRWPYFIRFGPPTSWWETYYREEGVMRAKILPTFFYWWTSADTGLACQAADGVSFATRELTAQSAKVEPRRPIYPLVEIVSFPNLDETQDVWFTIGIAGSDLTPFTVQSKYLDLEWSLKDGDGERIAGERLNHRLGLVGLVLSVTGNRNNLRIPIHFGVANLAPGSYELQVKVRGFRTNAGSETVEFEIPSPLASAGISDLLLVYRHGPRGSDLAPGVDRGGKNMCAVTEPVYYTGDTIFPFVEFLLPEGEEWAYAVSVYLRPVRLVRGAKVRTGKPVAIADSNDAPIARWAGIDINRELSVLGIHEPVRPKGITLLAARVYRGDQPIGVFESEFLVTPETSPGEYWLTIDVEGLDRDGRRMWRTTQKKIAIVRLSYSIGPNGDGR